MAILSCKVTSVKAITGTVYQVRLVPKMPFSFKAGQYLMVVMDECDRSPFSLASTPSHQEYIALCISRFGTESVCHGGNGTHFERTGDHCRCTAW